MAVLLAVPDRSLADLESEIHRKAPELDIRIWPNMGPMEEIDFAVLWRQPSGLLAQLKNLKAVSSFGAGVEHLLAAPDLPPDLPVGRLAGPRLASDMAAYLVAQVYGHWRRLQAFTNHQRKREWRPWSPPRAPKLGLLGSGHMARAALDAFRALDTPVRMFRRRPEPVTGVEVSSGPDGLMDLAAWSDYLVCLLPLTPETRGILNRRLFAAMPAHGVVINLGRGSHLVEEDLLQALDDGDIGRAILDVFEQEPLPREHPFWLHPGVTITPHCAGVTSDGEAADLIIRSYRQVLAGLGPLDPVDRIRGY
jgi:glyoxylate/hydroxypyruvate reductase A